MASVNDIRTSKYLKKEDVGVGILVTIKGLNKQNVALDGAEPDEKFILHFDELDKPLVLNSTNAQTIAKITGHEHDIEKTWVGTKVVLFNDENVSYAGKVIGGIRVRAPKGQKNDLPF